MGGTKKKQQNASLGKALVRQAKNDKKQKASQAKETGFHVADVATSNNKLKSITEMSSVEDFMANAVLADRQFQSNQDHVEVVEEHGQRAKAEQEAVKRHLSLPRRPAWDPSMTKEEILRNENDEFLLWRSTIAEAEQENPDVAVTPFEKNVEVWRQLWRVVEKSDMVVQIVDARNPLLFRCPDLEDYVKEIDSNKHNFLVVNKADFLTPEERVQWARYFRDNDVEFVFFSAKQEADKLEEYARQMEAAFQGETVSCDQNAENYEQENTELEKLCEHDPDLIKKSKLLGRESLLDLLHKYHGSFSKPSDENETTSCPGKLDSIQEDEIDPHDPRSALGGKYDTTEEEVTNYENELGTGAEAATFSGFSSFTGGAKGRRKGGARGGTGKRAKQSGVVDGAGIELNEEHVRWVNGVPVIDTSLATKAVQAATEGRDPNEAIEESKKEDKKRLDNSSTKDNTASTKEKKLTFGFVGYPNVGKSSVINLLLGASSQDAQSKRVAVSSTPGKTRHFQTHHLDDSTVICDCPGLVFPSFVSSKAEMVCNGVFPLSQLRDHVGPMNLVVQRIPRRTLESFYGIRLPPPVEDDNPERQPTVKELLDTFSTARGFMASTHAGPDHPRGARVILRDYVEGRLPYAHPPPGAPKKILPVAKDQTRSSIAAPLSFLSAREQRSYANVSSQVSPENFPTNNSISNASSQAADCPHHEETSDEHFVMSAFGSVEKSETKTSKKTMYISRKDAKRNKPRKKGDRDPDPYGTQKEEPTAQDFIHKVMENKQRVSTKGSKSRGPVSGEELFARGG